MRLSLHSLSVFNWRASAHALCPNVLPSVTCPKLVLVCARSTMFSSRSRDIVDVRSSTCACNRTNCSFTLQNFDITPLTRMSSSVCSLELPKMHHNEMFLLTYSMALSSSQNLGLLHDAHSSLLFDFCLHLFPCSSHKSFSISFSHVNLGHKFQFYLILSLSKVITFISSFPKLYIQHPLLGFFKI